ncbi:hypothetical protein [Phenylobacterium sp.]|uniref:hypothetical protein n=1 Tax=Phenylobacterium sp. TaxID=1871053 RepID=UPI002728A265|nr:hypothetical protein [Phenylobacterium sp.]MDO8377530.1 hypothetical protein [Phenylobacterium sp.]
MNRRLVGQLSSDYVLRWIRQSTALFGDITTAMIFATITQANTAYLDQRPEGTRAWGTLQKPAPDDLRRPITAHAAAAALGLPRETLRRKLNGLKAEGYIEETPDGVIIRAEAMLQPRVIATVIANTELARDFCLRLQRAGVVSIDRPASADLDEPLHRAIGRATNTFCLRFLENVMALSAGDLMLGLTACALEGANIRRLAESATELVGPIRTIPDSVRQPITAVALAGEIGLPRETTRRHLHKLIGLGVCRALPGGFIFTEARFNPTRIAASLGRTAANVRQLHATLIGVGVMLPIRAAPLAAAPPEPALAPG